MCLLFFAYLVGTLAFGHDAARLALGLLLQLLHLCVCICVCVGARHIYNESILPNDNNRLRSIIFFVHAFATLNLTHVLSYAYIHYTERSLVPLLVSGQLRPAYLECCVLLPPPSCSPTTTPHRRTLVVFRPHTRPPSLPPTHPLTGKAGRACESC